jgi:hypothetical protein
VRGTCHTHGWRAVGDKDKPRGRRGNEARHRHSAAIQQMWCATLVDVVSQNLGVFLFSVRGRGSPLDSVGPRPLVVRASTPAQLTRPEKRDDGWTQREGLPTKRLSLHGSEETGVTRPPAAVRRSGRSGDARAREPGFISSERGLCELGIGPRRSTRVSDSVGESMASSSRHAQSQTQARSTARLSCHPVVDIRSSNNATQCYATGGNSVRAK